MVMSERLKKKMSVLEIPIWGGYLRSQWEYTIEEGKEIARGFRDVIANLMK